MDPARNNKGAPKKPASKTQEKNAPQTPTLVLALPADNVSLAGPTDFCNWVLPDQLLMGAYPKRKTLLIDILKSGVTCFVNLIHEKELERIEKYGPYFDLAKKLVTENEGNMFKQNIKQLKYIHFPIRDCDCAPDDDVLNLVEQIYNLLLQGEKIFVHCRGGHGRTGTVIAILIAKIGKLDAYEALEKSQQYHDHRNDIKEKPDIYSCPETSVQKNQVYRIVGKF